jgi:hypothetical protein
LKNQVEESDDRLLTAMRIAIAGNVIDCGANWDFDLKDEIKEILHKDFAICDYGGFKNRLDEAHKILYNEDNARELLELDPEHIYLFITPGSSNLWNPSIQKAGKRPGRCSVCSRASS